MIMNNKTAYFWGFDINLSLNFSEIRISFLIDLPLYYTVEQTKCVFWIRPETRGKWTGSSSSSPEESEWSLSPYLYSHDHDVASWMLDATRKFVRVPHGPRWRYAAHVNEALCEFIYYMVFMLSKSGASCPCRAADHRGKLSPQPAH